jgi:hypothetical protein
MHDSARDVYNSSDKYMVPNSAAAEQSAYHLDFTSNGFKIRGTQTDENGNAYTMLFMAFAEMPLKYSNAR